MTESRSVGTGVWRTRGSLAEGHKETFGGDGCVQYLDDDGGFMGVYIWPDLPNCIL